jgi:hypothetical protein
MQRFNRISARIPAIVRASFLAALLFAVPPAMAESVGNGNGFGNGNIGSGYGNGYGNGPTVNGCSNLSWLKEALNRAGVAGVPDPGRGDCPDNSAGRYNGRGNVGAFNGLLNGLGNNSDQARGTNRSEHE